MDEDARAYEPIPGMIHQRIRTLHHDLARARENMQTGRLRPEQYTALSRVLDERLRVLEAEVEFRLLNEMRVSRGATASWKPTKGGRGAS